MAIKGKTFWRVERTKILSHLKSAKIPINHQCMGAEPNFTNKANTIKNSAPCLEYSLKKSRALHKNLPEATAWIKKYFILPNVEPLEKSKRPIKEIMFNSKAIQNLNNLWAANPQITLHKRMGELNIKPKYIEI